MKRLALLFPGQGSQHSGMMEEEYRTYPVVRHTFEEASDTLGYDMAELCFSGGEEQLARSELTQPALLAVGAASYRLFVQETGVRPAVAAGHSLGEYTALTCAGVLKFSDALGLVRERGRLMMEASASGKGKMLAVSGMSIQTIEEMISRIENIKDRPVIACYNSSRQAVLSGTAESVAAAEELLQSEGARLSPLKVSGAFHSPLMAGAAEELEQLLQSCELGAFDFPVISNVEAKPYDLRGENIIRCLKRQMTEPVHWQQTMTALLKHSIDAAVEFAPRKTLAGLFRTDYPSVPVYSLEDHAERQTVFSLSFKREYAFSYRYALGQCLALAASVRNQCLDDQMYREQVIAPYRKIEHLLLQLEQSDAEPSDDQLRQAWDGLKTIIRAKGAPEDEYRNPLNVMERMLSRC